MQAVFIKDLNIYAVDIPDVRGTNYYYNGQKLTKGRFQCDSLEGFEEELISTHSCYRHKETNEVLFSHDYRQKVREFGESIGVEYDEYNDPIFPDLDTEYTYRKFLSQWEPFYQTELNKTLIEFDVILTTYNTNNEFITCNYFLGSPLKEAMIFTYKQGIAIESIIKQTFKDLGMEFYGKVNYSETVNKKIWGNASHSGFRYCVAFGKYLFSDYSLVNVDTSRLTDQRGTLEDLERLYQRQKNALESHIRTEYGLHFNAFSKNDFREVFTDSMDLLNTTISHARFMHPKTQNDKEAQLKIVSQLEKLRQTVIDRVQEKVNNG